MGLNDIIKKARTEPSEPGPSPPTKATKKKPAKKPGNDLLTPLPADRSLRKRLNVEIDAQLHRELMQLALVLNRPLRDVCELHLKALVDEAKESGLL